jgi:SAM-dependent methyltransferase
MYKQKAIVVLGMHRAGTSAITRVLSLYGAALPQRLMAPSPDNEAGFWEPDDIVAKHEKLLASAASTWDDIREFPRSWFNSDIAIAYKRQILDALSQDYGGAPLFVVKDPRICRFIPFWLSVLEEYGVEPLFVIILRNPLEVAASLKARDGFPAAKSMLLWLRHVLSAERDTRGRKRTFVTYDSLLGDWRKVVAKIAVDLNIQWPQRSLETDIEIDEFLSSKWRHHSIPQEEVSLSSDIIDWVKSTFDWALSMASDLSPDPEILDHIYRELQKAEYVFGPYVAEIECERRETNEEVNRLTHEVTNLQSELATVRSAVGEAVSQVTNNLQSELATVRSAVGEREAWIETLTAELQQVRAAVSQVTNSLQSELATVRSAVGEREAWIETLTAELQQVRAAVSYMQSSLTERDRCIQQLHASTSWRVTAPLRTAKRAIVWITQYTYRHIEGGIRLMEKLSSLYLKRRARGLRGGVDGASGGKITGWLVPPVPIYVRAGSELLARIIPDVEREDLVKVGITTDPKVGFAFGITGEMLSRFDILRFLGHTRESFIELNGSPVSLRTIQAHAKTLAQMIASPPFEVEGARWVNDAMELVGYAIAAGRALSRDLRLVVNGESVDKIQWSKASTDLDKRFWFLGPLSNAQFKAYVSIGCTQRASEDSVKVELVNGASQVPVNPYRSFYLPKNLRFEGLPDRKRQLRVVGWADDFHFWIKGRSHFESYMRLFREHWHERDKKIAVLDWGCGCGRIIRHFLETGISCERLVGVDIDRDNIEWCRKHLLGAEFYATDLRPPLPFDDASFDLVYGNSVFTHLDELHQDLWLTELRRILQPNGIIVVSVHGATALAYGSAPQHLIDAWDEQGIIHPGRNQDLDGFISDPEYYWDTYHTQKYIYEHWGHVFDILAYHEMVFGYQDAVVLGKK